LYAGRIRLALAAAAVLCALAAGLAGWVMTGSARAATTVCKTSGPGTYTVTVCLTAPAAGATLKGSVPVTATVTSAAGAVASPGVQRAVFYIDNAYLLTDYSPLPSTTPATYTFTVKTTRWADGPRTLAVETLMRDGYVSQRAAMLVNFSNGQRQPPANTRRFTPPTGTAPAAGQPFVVAAVGDAVGGEPTETAVVEQIASWKPNMLLYLGDVYQKGSPTEFDNWYGTEAETRFYGRFRRITAPAIGNHEYENGTAPGYFDYWDNVPHYYSFDTAGWHFISLDSNTQYGQLDPGKPQYEWLAQDLAANAGKCTIAFYHHPLYDIGAEGPTEQVAPLWALLANAGVQLVLNGHDHTYQRWLPMDAQGQVVPHGTTQFVVGVGGHALQDIVTTDPRVGASVSREYGALQLQLTAAGATFIFHKADGTPVDAGFVPCDAQPTPPGSTPPEGTPGPTPPPSGGTPAQPTGQLPAAPPASPAVGPAGTGDPAAAPTKRSFGARLLARRLSVTARTRLRVRYAATAPARVTVALMRGRKRVLAVSGSAWTGRNALVLRAPAAIGSYRLVLTARALTAGRSVDGGVLTVRRAKSPTR
jgi:hypothetical protein